MSIFRFKQFEIKQDQCAMKIGTDGVLLGAWAAVAHAPNILDIGTGTGVLALMAAQRNPSAQVVAVEIEKQAAAQAQYNIARSPWAARVQMQHTAIQDFVAPKLFDAIISNPPYFEAAASTAIANQARQTARTTSQLPYTQLLKSASHLLSDTGIFSLVLPYTVGQQVILLAQKFHLFPCQIVAVSARVGKPPNRILLALTKQKTPNIIEQQLAIRKAGKGQQDYTTEFVALHQDFLLAL